MKRILFLWCLFLTVARHAEQCYHLERVVVTGSSRYSQEDLVRATALTANSEVTMADLQRGAGRWGNSGAPLTTALTSSSFWSEPWLWLMAGRGIG